MSARMGCGVGFVALGYIGVSARAAAGDRMLELENHASAAIMAFRTWEHGRWSANWIHRPVQTGDSRALNFGQPGDEGAVLAQISFADDTFIEVEVDGRKTQLLEIYSQFIKAA